MVARKSITIVSGTGSFSGSVERIQALGDYNGNSSIQNIEYGSQLDSAYTPTAIISASIQIPNGHSILGPIGRFKGESGDWLVYHD